MINNNVIQITLKVLDEASKQLKNATGNLSDFGSNNKKLFAGMTAAGGVALGAISTFAIKSIESYKDVEKANAQLEHAVLNVSHATREQLQATSDLADELQRKGVLDGDNIKMGLAQLSTFGLSNDAVRGLGKSLADLAVNQYGVTASGEQLSDTANMIAKALNGQFGILEKSGIRFTEAQQHMIKFGTEMEKVQAINEGFAQNLKYTNEVALGTMEGKMANINNSIGDVSEAIGGALAPALISLLDSIVPIVQGFSAWASLNPDLIATIIAVGGSISLLLVGIGTLGLAWGSLSTIMLTMVYPAIQSVAAAITILGGPISVLIVAIGVLAYTIYSNRDGIKQGTSDFVEAIGIYWDALGTNLTTIGMRIKQNLTEILVRGTLGVLTLGMSEFLIKRAGGWDNVVKYVHTALDPMVEFVSGIFDKISAFITKMKTGISSIGGGSLMSSITGNRAIGGPVVAGQPYMVGERGREIFIPSTNGRIDTKGSGSPSVSISIGNVHIKDQNDMNYFMNEMENRIRRSISNNSLYAV